MRVTACTHREVAAGMPLAEAQGMLGESARYVRHDPAEDAAALREAAAWCARFSPLVGVEGTDSLLLDVTGCAHLFGGERELLREVMEECRMRGFEVRAALADTVGLAWGVARCGGSAAEIVPPGETGVLAALPVEALRLPEGVVATLHELDLRRVGQLLGVGRALLPSRFGKEVVDRLDQALGERSEEIVAVLPPQSVEAGMAFEHPTGDRRGLEEVLRRLVAEVRDQVARRGEGIQQLRVELGCGRERERERVEFVVGTVAPCAAEEHLAELVLTQFERVSLPEEVQRVRMSVTAAASLAAWQPQLFEGADHAGEEREWTRLLDRLSNRLGKERVVQAQLRADAQPELAVEWEPVVKVRGENGSRGTVSPLLPHTSRRAGGRRFSGGQVGHANPSPPTPLPASNFHPVEDCRAGRGETVCPLRLLGEPERVRVEWPVRVVRGRRVLGIVRYWGPERIETGWWRGEYVRRDYYRVETESGERFWLYRRVREGDWFLHGEFD